MDNPYIAADGLAYAAESTGHMPAVPARQLKQAYEAYKALRSAGQEIADNDDYANFSHCPITRDAMSRPVLCWEDGVVYEHAALTRWLKMRGNSPVTNLPLPKRVTLIYAPNMAALSAACGAEIDCMKGKQPVEVWHEVKSQAELEAELQATGMRRSTTLVGPMIASVTGCLWGPALCAGVAVSPYMVACLCGMGLAAGTYSLERHQRAFSVHDAALEAPVVLTMTH